MRYCGNDLNIDHTIQYWTGCILPTPSALQVTLSLVVTNNYERDYNGMYHISQDHYMNNMYIVLNNWEYYDEDIIIEIATEITNILIGEEHQLHENLFKIIKHGIIITIDDFKEGE